MGRHAGGLAPVVNGDEIGARVGSVADFVAMRARRAGGASRRGEPAGAIGNSRAMLPTYLRHASTLAIAASLACGTELRDEGASSSVGMTSASTPGDVTGGADDSNDPDDGPGPADGTAADSSTGGGALFDLGTNDDDGGGVVPTTCDELGTTETTVGCTFYAVDLDQAQIFEGQQFAVVVSNVQGAAVAEVIVEAREAGAWVTVAGPVDVPAMSLHTFELDNRVQTGSGIKAGGAYRVTASIPIIAYQFNPLVMGWWSSDASLLYPVEAWDTLVDVVHWGAGAGLGYTTVVAAHDGTVVTVRPTVNTTGAGGVPPGVAGGAFDVVLDEGDVAQIAVAAEHASLTGTRIESDHPIAVFTGHECAFVPADKYACDHLEEQMAGLRLWGKTFVAARVPPRIPENPETSLWQIYASEDDTTVVLEAPAGATGLPAGPLSLDRGELIEFYTAGNIAAPGDFYIEADRPIAVFNYMTGYENMDGAPQIGDPAMLQLGPVEQFLDRYVLLVPSQWSWDFLVITRPEGEGVEVDGVPVDEGLFFDAGGGFEVARVSVEDGVHEVSGSAPISVAVVGYDTADSYAYLGGGGTGVINPEPAG